MNMKNGPYKRAGFIKETEYKETLDESVSYFLTKARNKKNFNKKNWVTSIKSNELIL